MSVKPGVSRYTDALARRTRIASRIAFYWRIRVLELKRLAPIVIFSDVTCDTIGIPSGIPHQASPT
jgi:hypothetical protein